MKREPWRGTVERARRGRELGGGGGAREGGRRERREKNAWEAARSAADSATKLLKILVDFEQPDLSVLVLLVRQLARLFMRFSFSSPPCPVHCSFTPVPAPSLYSRVPRNSLYFSRSVILFLSISLSRSIRLYFIRIIRADPLSFFLPSSPLPPPSRVLH